MCAAWLAAGVSAYASDVKNALPKRVLVISFFDAGIPWANRVVESLRRNLDSESPYPIDLHIEFADLAYYTDEAYRQKLIELYRYKYPHSQLDLVIGIGDEEADFLIAYAEDLFGTIPMVVVSADPKALKRESLKSHMTSLVWEADIQGNIQSNTSGKAGGL
ncbi:hypothetical protein [Desulforhabdus sp. TSK]|uniref:hypothetical protein n=1 Tax=Desulforhabdus sp. TSK TaxID=2925014 RepID=UPI001FC86450|nr:hypothetical protein [Desulforhabdus sp. TSK]